ncbi:MAG TPA: protein kinase [Gemmatimonadales bacterium]|nr:protein kinase [Gemmatimonadales bacterium]
MDIIAQFKQALSDRYAIEREIGAGGMATVYLARDLRHDRPVALKLLNPELGAVLGVERFLAEIKVTANLQHPNLLPLFDSGEAGGQLYYVMPFVAGESLRVRLEREKQLPIDDAIRIAVAVANALDYAHSHGVIHRDLKPENILIQAGQPVVADFGIALAVSKAGGNRITQTGLSLGTPQYMSPEQATGDRVIDGRSDIYSLAAMTYEMLTGEPPHIGNTAQAIIARVLTDKPRPVRHTRSAVPEQVDAAIDHALQKLPADRYATAREFADALQGRGPSVTYGPITAAVAPGGRPVRARLRVPVTVALVAMALALGAVAGFLLKRPAASTPAPVIRFRFSGSDSVPVIARYPWPAAISPDGGKLAYWVDRGGEPELMLRRLDQLDSRPVPGTRGGSQVLFSPDGEWIAFETSDKEKKVRLDGSAPVTIAEGAGNNGAAWTTAGELVVGATRGKAGLSRVPVSGGELVQFTHPDSAGGDLDHLWPIAHADGRTIVFTSWGGGLTTASLAMTTLPDGKVTRLGIKGIRPLAILDDQLVYLQADGTVMAVALDVSGRKVDGSPTPVHDPVQVAPNNNGNSDVFISSGGALVSAVGSTASRLSWLSRDGSSRLVQPDARDYQVPRISPDGRRIAVLVRDGTSQDVWIHDLPTGTLSRLTDAARVTSVEWSRDGKRVIYTAPGPDARGVVWSKMVDVASPPEVLLRLPGLTPSATMAPDGQSLLVRSLGASGWEVFRSTIGSTAAPTPWASGRGDDYSVRISPDGHWAALVNDESGRDEAYVRSYPDPAAKVQVSVGGAQALAWSADGTRLYYASSAGIVSARLALGATVQVLSRDTVFRSRGNLTFLSTFSESNFDLSLDGSRVLYLAPVSSSYELIVVPNWLREFREKLARR